MFKSIKWINIFLILLVVSLIVGGVVIWQYLKILNEKILEVKLAEVMHKEGYVNETVRWETYRSNEYKFEINYPYTWNTGINPMGGGPAIIPPLTESKEGAFPVIWDTKVWFGRTGVQTVDEIISEVTNPDNNKLISESVISLGNLNGREIVYTCKDCGIKYDSAFDLYRPGREGKIVFIENNEDIFFIWLFYYKNDPKADYYMNVFNQMLSTFKFLK